MAKLPDCYTLCHFYDDLGMSQIDIAQYYGVSRQAVSQKMEKCQIEVRTKSEARKLAIKEGRVVYDVQQ